MGLALKMAIHGGVGHRRKGVQRIFYGKVNLGS
jgi:hypothetical protein